MDAIKWLTQENGVVAQVWHSINFFFIIQVLSSAVANTFSYYSLEETRDREICPIF